MTFCLHWASSTPGAGVPATHGGLNRSARQAQERRLFRVVKSPDTVTTYRHNFDTLYTLYASVSELLRSTSFDPPEHLGPSPSYHLNPRRIQVKMCRCVLRCAAYVQKVKFCTPKLDDIAKASTVWSFRSISLSTQLS